MRFPVSVRGPAFVVGLYLVLLSIPQIREVFLIAIEKQAPEVRYYFSGVLFAFFSIQVFLWSVVLRLNTTPASEQNNINFLNRTLWNSSWFSSIPSLAALYVILVLINSNAPYAGALQVIGLIAVALSCIYLMRWFYSRQPEYYEVTLFSCLHPKNKIYRLNYFLSTVAMTFLTLFLLLSFFAPLVLSDIEDTLGPIGIALLFLIFLLNAMSLVQFYWDSHGRSGWIAYIAFALVVASIYFQAYGKNEYFVRVLGKNDNLISINDPQCAAGCESESALPIADQFEKWINLRKRDIERFSQNRGKFPVYFISAHGGGSYSAFQVAFVLSAIQDICPSFRNHVFIASGVSGGALGLATFSALMANLEEMGSDCQISKEIGSGPSAARAENFLSGNFLNAITSRALFADLPSQFLSIGPPPSDRSQAFEDNLMRRWSRSAPTNFWERPLAETWSPASRFPALLINATVVETGQRLIFSPFSLQRHTALLRHLHPKNEELNRYRIPAVGTVGLSARFPLLAPAGTLPTKEYSLRVVDGAYFENSGALPLVELLPVFREVVKKLEVPVDLRAISFSVSRKSYLTPANAPKSFNDLASPFRAAFAVRYLYGLEQIDAFQAQFNSLRETTVCRLFVLGTQPGLPLGWVLSDKSRKQIKQQSIEGFQPIHNESALQSSDCDGALDENQQVARNGETIMQIVRDLSPDLKVTAIQR